MPKNVKKILLGGAITLVVACVIEYKMFTNSTEMVNAHFKSIEHQNKVLLKEVYSVKEELKKINKHK